MSWVALMSRELGAEELAAMRAEVVKEWGFDSFTCDDCPAKPTCPFVFDAYNIGGDCLAEK